MTDRALTTTRRPAEPWRQRLIRSLLYGRNVDRAAKARARVGLAILAFAVVYAVLAGRLVMFAVGADSHGARRTASQDAIATARPDIVDRNGEVLATDVKAPSLFGEPQAHHRQGRGDRTPDRGAAGPRRSGGAHAPVVAQGFCLAEARDHAKAAAKHPQARHSRHRLPAREQARLPDRRVGRAPDRPRQYRQPGHRRDGKMAGQ